MRISAKKKIILCTALFGFLLSALPSVAEEYSVFKTDAFGDLKRPIATFDHDAHNEMAELEDCSICHHVYEDGVKVEDMSSEDAACSDCHSLKAEGRQPGLREAYHKQCKNCHSEREAGPVACGECHRR